MQHAQTFTDIVRQLYTTESDGRKKPKKLTYFYLWPYDGPIIYVFTR
ncbi:MAG: hypothetical protein ACYSTT_20415 [Planctomycetota bacterium]